MEILHREFKSLRESLKFSHQEVESLAAVKASLWDSVGQISENVTHLHQTPACGGVLRVWADGYPASVGHRGMCRGKVCRAAAAEADALHGICNHGIKD